MSPVGGIDPDLEDALAEARGTIAVIGATGMVGRAVLGLLAGASDRLRVVAAARRPASLPEGVEEVAGSVEDPAFWRDLPPLDYTVYLAGATSAYLERPVDTIAAGSTGVGRSLEIRPPSRGFVFASSTRVYGRHPGREPVEEDAAAIVRAMDTDNVYDSTKRLGESLVLHHARRGVPATAVRFTNVYGRTPAGGSRTSISEWIDQGLREGRLTLRGHPDTVRNHVEARDAATGALLALLRGDPGEAYNVGSEEHLTNREVVDAIADALPGDVEVEEVGGAGEPSVTRIDIGKAVERLGYRPRRRLADTLPELVQAESNP